MVKLQSCQKKVLFVEFVQFLTPKQLLPNGVCIVVSIELSVSRTRIIPKLFVNLWGNKKVYFKILHFEV